MDKRGCIIVTLRDRDVHRDVFLLYMSTYFPHLSIIMVEQCDQRAWNKGLLYNTAYRLLGHMYDYLILHDIDFIPARTVDYSYTPMPTLLSTECSQYNYGYYFDTYFGGVLGISKQHYELLNGFSNSFVGYGGEDCEFRNRCVTKGLHPQKRLGNRFECFAHPKPDIHPGSPFYNTIEYQNNLSLATTTPDFRDGLTTATYKLIGITVHDTFTHIQIHT